MIASLYKRKRRRGGKLVVGRVWRVKLRLDGELKMRDVSLRVTDRHVAEQKLRALILEGEKESVGMLAPKLIREAAQKPIAVHTGAYVRDLETKGRNRVYLNCVENYLESLGEACGWKFLRDITAASFLEWRRGAKKSAKTLNEYLIAARAFLNWTVGVGYLEKNPLANIQTVEVVRGEMYRHSFTAAEIVALLTVAGPRKPVYLTALLTGLRRGELQKLNWRDLDLDGKTLKVRAAISKNRREAVLPLHPDLVAELRNVKEKAPESAEYVFKGLIPRMPRFYADLKAADIKTDGGRLDFHSLRKTYCTYTWLARRK